MNYLLPGLTKDSITSPGEKMHFKKNALIAVFLFMMTMVSFDDLTGQVIPAPEAEAEQEESHVRYSLLPILGYTSDIGLFGGVFLGRTDYGVNPSAPFLSNMRGDVYGSLKGEFQAGLSYDRTRTFQRDFRSTLTLTFFRSKNSHYFGLGNDTSFSDELYDENFFFYEGRQFNFMYRGRKIVREFGFEGRLEIFSNLKVSYYDASVREESSLFAEDRDQLQTDGWINKIGLGMIAGDRDSEFNPTSGFWYSTGFQVSNAVLGSNNDFADLWLELLHYVEIMPNMVIAQKIRGAHIIGDAPFWGLATLGDEDGLRGFHLDRFRGRSSVLHIMELRTWLFSAFDNQIRFGGQLFWDSGRVYSSAGSNRFFGNWKHAYGLGAVMSLFSPDFIVRGDLGFSNETVRIYAGIGYIF